MSDRQGVLIKIKDAVASLEDTRRDRQGVLIKIKDAVASLEDARRQMIEAPREFEADEIEAVSKAQHAALKAGERIRAR